MLQAYRAATTEGRRGTVVFKSVIMVISEFGIAVGMQTIFLSKSRPDLSSIPVIQATVMSHLTGSWLIYSIKCQMPTSSPIILQFDNCQARKCEKVDAIVRGRLDLKHIIPP